MRTRKTILMNGRTSLILISGVLLLILLAAGISISAEIPGANTPPRGGMDAATRTGMDNADAAARAKARPVLEKFQQSPAVFIENQGQWEDASIRFAMNSMGANAGLTSRSVRFQLFQREGVSSHAETRRRGEQNSPFSLRGSAALREADLRSASKMKEFAIRFEGARAVAPAGEGKSDQVFHYRRGEPECWRENVPSWDAVVYRGLWDGVDLRVTGQRMDVKYEFLVSPGADWRKIRVRYEGIEGLALRADGSLELDLGAGWKPLADATPYIYQETASGRKAMAGRFSLAGDRVCAFEITGPFDPALPLVIDPELAWSSYLGGSGDDYGYGIAVDGAGNVFVTGGTYSSGWVSGGFDTTHNGLQDAFVVKLSGSGAHVWSTYLGGDNDDYGRAIAVDGSGNMFVTGYTESEGWVSGGFDTTLDVYTDAFVAKLSGSGLHLWSTYLGGSDAEGGGGIALDDAGNVFVTGLTSSSGWVSGGFDTTLNGGDDAFVVKLSGGGAHLWSTYLGGSNRDVGADIAVDGAGNVFVTGLTESSGWVLGGSDTTYNGNYDAFVAKLSESGSHLWSTYLGGSGNDSAWGIAADSAGNVFVTGDTQSPGWVSGGFDTTYNGNDAFVVKLSGGGAHLWSTYLDGDRGTDIAVDGAGNMFVIGLTGSPGWVSGGFDTTYNGSGDMYYAGDAFVAELSGGGAHLWSSYLGGTADEWGSGIAVDGAGNVFVTGMTKSSGWVSGGFDTTFNGGYDAFVAKIRDVAPPRADVSGAWRLY